ncbi:MAG: peptide chain release factor 1 [Rectinema sp.]|nr:peptide chain release factor 1 [Rectinema sp.]
MEERIQQMRSRIAEIDTCISSPDIMRDQDTFRSLMKERARLSEIVELFDEQQRLAVTIHDTQQLLRESSDEEMKSLAEEELSQLTARWQETGDRLMALLMPRDPMADKPVIMEIRAGTGGEEASLFASDLFRMYSRYADHRGWTLEVMSLNETELGGMKEIIFSVSGDAVYERLRYESGVHRVQRVPVTESSGRIHTSAVTVAVLPEMEETEVEIRQEDLRIDVMRASGPGGQSVNTTDSAVRITHLPTGIVVHCQDEKSQIKNKAKAMRILRARLYELEEEKRRMERSAERRSQVGTGDRSERIRTYNFPQNRLTDHRIDLTLYKLDLVMEGELDELLDALVAWGQQNRKME